METVPSRTVGLVCDPPGRLASQYRVPLWSWAYVDGVISFKEHFDIHICTEVLDVEVKIRPYGDPYRAIVTASLTLQGPCCRHIQLEKFVEMYAWNLDANRRSRGDVGQDRMCFDYGIDIYKPRFRSTLLFVTTEIRVKYERGKTSGLILQVGECEQYRCVEVFNINASTYRGLTLVLSTATIV